MSINCPHRLPASAKAAPWNHPPLLICLRNIGEGTLLPLIFFLGNVPSNSMDTVMLPLFCENFCFVELSVLQK